MPNTQTTIIPQVLSIFSAAGLLSKNGYGKQGLWSTELLDAARAGQIPVHNYANGESFATLSSVLKTADLSEYLIVHHKSDLLRQSNAPMPVQTPVIPATAQTVAAIAPAVAAEPARDGPAPLTTGDAAHCFNGLRWTEQGWKNTLGEVKTRKWLQSCVTMRGQQGFVEARWNPVLLCAYLVRQGHVNARNVRAKFQTVDLLSPWLDAWKTYEADNLDTP